LKRKNIEKLAQIILYNNLLGSAGEQQTASSDENKSSTVDIESWWCITPFPKLNLK
jgi:hypothetical protein